MRDGRISSDATLHRFRLHHQAFGGVTALDERRFTIERGECHGLMGENGAGKSTLGKILAGIHRPDAGALRIDGEPPVPLRRADASAPASAWSTRSWRSARTSASPRTCAWASTRGACGLFRRPRAMCRPRPRRSWRRSACPRRVAADAAAHDGQEQLVQIAAAVGTGAHILVFDEPTSSLSEAEARAALRADRTARAARA